MHTLYGLRPKTYQEWAEKLGTDPPQEPSAGVWPWCHPHLGLLAFICGTWLLPPWQTNKVSKGQVLFMGTATTSAFSFCNNSHRSSTQYRCFLWTSCEWGRLLSSFCCHSAPCHQFQKSWEINFPKFLLLRQNMVKVCHAQDWGEMGKFREEMGNKQSRKRAFAFISARSTDPWLCEHVKTGVVEAERAHGIPSEREVQIPVPKTCGICISWQLLTRQILSHPGPTASGTLGQGTVICFNKT